MTEQEHLAAEKKIKEGKAILAERKSQLCRRLRPLTRFPTTA